LKRATPTKPGPWRPPHLQGALSVRGTCEGREGGREGGREKQCEGCFYFLPLVRHQQSK
jgi:hypothetical protein